MASTTWPLPRGHGSSCRWSIAWMTSRRGDCASRSPAERVAATAINDANRLFRVMRTSFPGHGTLLNPKKCAGLPGNFHAQHAGLRRDRTFADASVETKPGETDATECAAEELGRRRSRSGLHDFEDVLHARHIEQELDARRRVEQENLAVAAGGHLAQRNQRAQPATVEKTRLREINLDVFR